MMEKAVYTLGCGDRFGHEGEAQLTAYIEAKKQGIDVCPVWNKSNREHKTVHTEPASLRAEADAAVAALGWSGKYFVDADHISLANVDGFIESSDFFTLDVAENIGEAAAQSDVDAFVESMSRYTGEIELPGLDEKPAVSTGDVRKIAEHYLSAVQEAGRIYRHIAGKKTGAFAVEVSMDETEAPQTPVEMLFILAMIAQEKIPVDTIAPKFSGRFNKGVDYVGDVAQFEKEFEQDVAVLRFAAEQFGLKKTLRLSVHSGSDKFAIYPAMNRIIKKYGAGLHVKTAGTTWLEEVIGLAEAGGDGLAVAKKIYAGALSRYDELAAPYATVIDIDPAKLPSIETVNGWSSEQYVNALRHEQSCSAYNVSFRQLIHVAYKVAYELGDEFFQALEKHSDIVGRNVTHNLLKRHLIPIFG
ncbi:MAG: tagaturonate epimerase family protein [Kiritimatiellales bacterium]|nr:tagaturonate epimerase family protein [Kiritimatiellales bacterium]